MEAGGNFKVIMNKLSKNELMSKLKLLRPFENKQQRNEIVCALIGHSEIVEVCWGYWTCGRCIEQLGDSLGGAYSNTVAVIVGHNCKVCRKNYKALTWKDKLYCPDPFKKHE